MDIIQVDEDAHCLEYVLNVIVQANAYKQYLEQLFYTNQNRIDIINDSAPTFFVMSKQAFIEAIIMRISKVTDPVATGKFKNLTLQTLLKKLIPEDEPVHREIESQLVELNEQIENLRQLRNKQLGHLDLASIGAEFPITLNDINNALSLLEKV